MSEPPSEADEPDADEPDADADAEPAEQPEAGPLNSAARWAADFFALLVLAGVLWYLESYDGGFFTGLGAVYKVAIVGLLAAPAAVAEAARLPRIARGLLALWGIGGILALVFAVNRTNFVVPTFTYALTPIVALSALRIWHRSWGGRALGALLLLAFGRYWYHSALAWWGNILSSGKTVFWLSLSWHNQSAILMGGFGLLFAGVAIAGKSWARWLFALASALALGSVWLTGSRGGIIATAIGLIVLAVVSTRAVGFKTTGIALGLLVVSAVAVAIIMLSLPGGASGSNESSGAGPISSRESADVTFKARFYHWEAALKMLAARPATGFGLGSYRDIAPRYTSPKATLTSTAHNEYLQAFAEGGLVFGSAVLGFALVAAWLLLRRLRFGVPSEPEDSTSDSSLARSLQIGACGALAALLAHAAIDFDWLYPVLPALAAISLAIVYTRPEGNARLTRANWSQYLWGIPIVILLMTGVAAHIYQRSFLASNAANPDSMSATAPWDATGTAGNAMELALAGQPDRAIAVIDRGLRWNPSSTLLRTTRAEIALNSGSGTTDQLVATLVDGESSFSAYNDVATDLYDHADYGRAQEVLDREFALYASHPGWFAARETHQSWLLRIRIAGTTQGCDAAQAAADKAGAATSTNGPPSPQFKSEADKYCV